MTNKIHILYTIPNFDTAGSGKVVYDLTKYIDPKRFKVSIACHHDKGDFFKEVAALGISIYLMDVVISLRPYYNLIQRTKAFRAFLKTEKVDVVHSWNWSSNWSEVLACKLAGVTYVYTKKSMGFDNRHWKLKSYLSDFIITCNTDMQSFFSYKKQQRLIPFGLDTYYYQPEHVSNELKRNVFKIVTVANLVPVKHIELLLHAVKELKHLNLQLDIVGDTRNAYAKELEQLTVELQIESNVHFLGKQADVRPLLAKSDLYIIPSKKEGMPMALVEAMAMAIPVLGSDISGIRYVLQDFDQLLYPVSDLQALVTKIQMIYHQSPQERFKLGQALRAYCVSHFSMFTFIAAHEELYLELQKPLP